MISNLSYIYGFSFNGFRVKCMLLVGKRENKKENGRKGMICHFFYVVWYKILPIIVEERRKIERFGVPLLIYLYLFSTKIIINAKIISLIFLLLSFIPFFSLTDNTLKYGEVN